MENSKYKQKINLKFGFPDGSDSKVSAYNAGDPGLIPGSGRPPGGGPDNALQCLCLKNPLDREAWQDSKTLT